LDEDDRSCDKEKTDVTATLRAVYRNGVFIPETACDLPEDSQVELTVQGPVVVPASVTDPEQRALIRKQLVERMRRNPVPKDAPRFTREQLHERS
jgi:predicted DNA-binding antitoxin AbrB/MazE fold protein